MTEYINIDKIKGRENETDAPCTVNYGNLEIAIPFRFVRYVDNLHKRIEKLESELEIIKNQTIREVCDEMAQNEIESFITKWKVEGKTKLSILDIVENLCLPVEQIDKIMKKLEKRGLKEID